MNYKAVIAVVAALIMAGSALSFAADRDPKGGQGMQGMHEGQGMMSACPMMGGGMMSGGMMGRGMMAGGAMPQLPPGNEKLQLQMWGEMMQKMGEIASKYAAQVK